MSRKSSVVKFFEETASSPIAGIADIGRFRDNVTGHFLVPFTKGSAIPLDAMLAEFGACTGSTEIPYGTIFHKNAGMI
jgi:hypothetical protein